MSLLLWDEEFPDMSILESLFPSDVAHGSKTILELRRAWRSAGQSSPIIPKN